MLSDRKCIIIYMYLKCVCIVMISTDGSMHNKRFIILNRRLLLHVANCMQIHITIMLFCVKNVFRKIIPLAHGFIHKERKSHQGHWVRDLAPDRLSIKLDYSSALVSSVIAY